MKYFVTIVKGWKPLTIITKRSILDVTATLDPASGISLELCQKSVKYILNSNYTQFNLRSAIREQTKQIGSPCISHVT